MANQQDLSKHFEAILGRKLDADDPVVIRDNVGFRTFDNNGELTSREIGSTGESTKQRQVVNVLDVSGSTVIFADGRAVFALSDYYFPFELELERVHFRPPVNLVATANSRSPVFVTSRQTVSPRETDITIELFAWDAEGAPKNDVVIDWRCSAPFLTY